MIWVTKVPAYNFKKQFAPLVESGQKCQTIRKTDKGAKIGDTAYLYYGQRTKECRKLGEGKITSVLPIKVYLNFLGWQCAEIVHPDETIEYTFFMLDELAESDGFKSREEMVSFFDKQYGLPFNGFLHKWILNKP